MYLSVVPPRVQCSRVVSLKPQLVSELLTRLLEQILGAICNGVSTGQHNEPVVRCEL